MRGATTAVPAFSAGDRVRVRDETPRYHHRTPQYVKARRGRVVEFIGAYLNSETRSHGDDGLPEVPMYRVEFDMTELWIEYRASATDKVWIDLYEHWIDGEARRGGARAYLREATLRAVRNAGIVTLARDLESPEA